MTSSLFLDSCGDIIEYTDGARGTRCRGGRLATLGQPLDFRRRGPMEAWGSERTS